MINELNQTRKISTKTRIKDHLGYDSLIREVAGIQKRLEFEKSKSSRARLEQKKNFYRLKSREIEKQKTLVLFEKNTAMVTNIFQIYKNMPHSDPNYNVNIFSLNSRYLELFDKFNLDVIKTNVNTLYQQFIQNPNYTRNDTILSQFLIFILPEFENTETLNNLIFALGGKYSSYFSSGNQKPKEMISDLFKNLNQGFLNAQTITIKGVDDAEILGTGYAFLSYLNQKNTTK